MKRYAVRNLRLCTKDCICLYVCPYGATDTEDSIIDVNQCVGCGVCADACPSHAISMVPYDYPPQQAKATDVTTIEMMMANQKANGETIASQLASNAKDDGTYRLMKAIERSLRLVNEDLLRESGYMLPQSGNTHAVLRSWIEQPPREDFPIDTAKALDQSLPTNDGKTIAGSEVVETLHHWQCKVCGYIVEAESLPDDFICPACAQPKEMFEMID